MHTTKYPLVPLKLDTGKETFIQPPGEEENLITAIEERISSDVKSSSYSPLSKYAEFIISLKDNPNLIESFLIHNHHFLAKDPKTNGIIRDPLFPSIIVIKNLGKKQEILDKIKKEKPVKKAILEKKIKENFLEKALNLSLVSFSWLLIASQRLMDKDTHLQSIVKSESMKGRGASIKSIMHELKRILPESEGLVNTEELEKSFEEFAYISPVILKDLLSFWTYEGLQMLIESSLELTTKQCYGCEYSEYEKIILDMEQRDFIEPLLTISMCTNPTCDYLAISSNKINTLQCPRCMNQDGLFSVVVYKFDKFLEDLLFEKHISPAHSTLPYIISHYLRYHSESRLSTITLRKISVGKDPKTEEYDTLVVTSKNKPIVIESAIFKERDGPLDQLRSKCKNEISDIKRKMDFIGASDGYVVTNLKNNSSIAQINSSENTEKKGIKLLASDEIITQLNAIILKA